MRNRFVEKGMPVWQVVCDFDDKRIEKAIVTEVHEDYFVAEYTSFTLSGISLYLTEPDIGRTIFFDAEAANRALAEAVKRGYA